MTEARLVDWATFITAAAALLAAMVALYQARLQGLSLRADLILRLDERFEGHEYCVKRRAAVEAIRTKENMEDVDDVLDFFEGLALLVRRKTVDKTLVWHYFFHWLHGYWLHTKDYIDEKRRKEPPVYGDLLWLHEELFAIEKCKREAAGAEPGPPVETWSRFLEDEASCGEND